MNRNVLVIGSYKPRGADCCTWDDYNNNYNLTDYGVVILDTNYLYQVWSIDRNVQKTYIVGNVEKTRSIISSFPLLRKKILECLSIDTQIFVLFHPTVELKEYLNSASFYTNDWFPISIESEIDSGTTVNVKSKVYNGYLKRLNQWQYYYLPESFNEYSEIREFYSLDTVRGKRKVIATNKLEKPLAIELSFFFRKQYSSPFTEQDSRIILLPITNDKDTCDDIDTIISLTKSIEKSEAPEWVNKINIPNEVSIKTELDNTEIKLSEIRNSYENLVQHKLLLYENSFALQDICAQTLKELGANIKESKVSDEFIAEHKGNEVLVEIKGKNKSIDKDDIGQLITDIGQHVSKVGTAITGLFIGNGWRNLPPEERGKGNKATFPKEIIHIAETQNIGLLSSFELFKAYCKISEGNLSKEDFLNTILTHKGVITF
ncbi:hypothetical protein ACFLUR_01950 [Chloroflexota bacterium]